MSPSIRGLVIAACMFGFSMAEGSDGKTAAHTSAPIAVQLMGSSLSAQEVRDEGEREELAAVTQRLASVEASIAKTSERADQVAQRTSWFSLGTVAIGALLAALASMGGQMLLMRHQRKINRADAEAKVSNTYVEWQLRQLSELYAPLRALLSQSNVLYRQMNNALVEADPNRFRLVDGGDYDGKVFEIRSGEEWVRFRTVEHIAEVFNRGYGVEPYFNDVVDVGQRLVDLIQEKAGYARQEDDQLVQVMGQYLAHFFVLKRLLDRVNKNESPHETSVDKLATFPTEIQALVNNGFKEINKQVIEWRRFKQLTN